MAETSASDGVVNARIVFWGIEGSGKTANLEAIYAKLRPDHRGEMRSMPTAFDPTVRYEELPIELGEIAGVRTQIQLVAVPGGAEQAPTRKQLLDEADGIVLVVDSQRERIDENVASLEELRKSLADYGRSLDDLPIVVQHNKRDLGDPYVQEELHRRLGLDAAAVFEAVATQQTGVLQTLSTISKRVIRTLRERGVEPRAEPTPAAPPTLLDVPTPEPAHPAEAQTPAERMEAAILEEAEDPERGAVNEAARRAESLLDTSWDPIASDLEQPVGVRMGADLSIVSVGKATRSGERAVRVPLVLGDADGNTSTLLLTIQLDPLMDED